MRKLKSIVLTTIAVLSIALLSGCSSLLDIYESSTTTVTQESPNLNLDSNGTINLVNFFLDSVEVEAYSDISEDAAAAVVASIVMPATLEISCTINYSYTSASYYPWGGGNTTRTGSESSLATGFIINEDGYIITNAHVVTVSDTALTMQPNFQYTNRKIMVNYADSRTEFPAVIIAYDVDLDLAILKMDPSTITNYKWTTFYNLTGNDDPKFMTEEAVLLGYGEIAIAIGNANGYGLSVTQGVISAPTRTFVDNGVSIEAIQTDAAINSGNSGGPLCNKYGAVVGVNSFKIVTSTSENLGYAVPANVIIDFIKSKSTTDAPIKYYYTNTRSFDPETVLSN